LKRLFSAAYNALRDAGYFQKVLGTPCVDGYVPGEAGTDVNAFFYRKLKRDRLAPVEDRWEYYDEDELFDVVEPSLFLPVRRVEVRVVLDFTLPADTRVEVLREFAIAVQRVRVEQLAALTGKRQAALVVA
jgi:hypothetical protein